MIKLTQNQFSGSLKDLPLTLPSGSVFFDTENSDVYIYNFLSKPIKVGGNHDFSSITGINGNPDGTKFLRDDGTWVGIPGGGDALTSAGLAQFSTTTSNELLNIISDPEGFGKLLFNNSPSLINPSLGVATATSINGVTIDLNSLSGINTGDQDSIIGITGTKLEFNNALSNGSFMFSGDDPSIHSHDLSDLNTTGTSDSTTYLRGDGQWSTIPAGSGEDSQTLTLVGDQLTIENGNTVTLPSGGYESIITEEAFEALTVQEQTDYRGFKSAPLESPDVYPQDDALSAADLNSIVGWSGNTVSVDNTITNGSSFSLKLTQDGTDAGRITQKTITGLDENSTYRISADGYKTSWSRLEMRVISNEHPNYTGKVISQNETNQWNSGSLDINTGAGETSIVLEVYLNSTASNTHIGYIDNIKIVKSVPVLDYETFVETIASYKDADGFTEIKTPSKNIFFDDSESELATNNVQKALEKLESKNKDLFNTQQYSYTVSISNGTINAISSDKNFPNLSSSDLSDIAEAIQTTRIDPLKSVVGNHAISLYFKNGKYNHTRPIEFSGSYPANTDSIRIGLVIEGESHVGVAFNLNAINNGGDVLTFTDGLRVRLENFRVSAAAGNGRALYFKKPDVAGGYSVRDSYINQVYTYHSTAGYSVEFENMFSVVAPRIKVYNFLGSGVNLKNDSNTTNYGNSAFGKFNVVSSGLDGTTGFKVETTGGGNIMNLLTIDYLELGSNLGEGGGGAAKGIHLDTASNITIGMLVSEYLGENLHVDHSSNITVINSIFTIERATSQLANEAYAIWLENSSNVKILNGIYYTTDQTAAPLIVSNEAGKGGNIVNGQLVNGFALSNIQRTGPELTEIHFHEDGTSNRLDIWPENKYFNPIAVNGSSLGAPFLSTDNTLELALQRAALNGTGGVTDGDKGQIIVSNSGTTWELDPSFNGFSTYLSNGSVPNTKLSSSGANEGDVLTRVGNNVAWAQPSVSGLSSENQRKIDNSRDFDVIYHTSNQSVNSPTYITTSTVNNENLKVVNTVENTNDVDFTIEDFASVGQTVIIDNDGTGTVNVIADSTETFIGLDFTGAENATTIPSGGRMIALKKKANLWRLDGNHTPYVFSGSPWPQPTFDSATGLSFNNGSSVSGGVGIAVGSGSSTSAANHSIYADSLTIGTTYNVSFDVQRTAGTGNGYVGNGTTVIYNASNINNTVQTFSFSFTATNTNLNFAFDAGTTGQIDNVIIT